MAGRFIVAAGSPSEWVCRLPSSVRGIGQLIEIPSRAVQPFLDGSRCRFSCCLTSLGSFLAIIPSRQRWRVLRLVHEPQHSRGPPNRELSRPVGQKIGARDAFLTLAGAVG